ncbi:MAG: integration host factor subunit alpha [Endozoicomonadaceae bacterium]|nr:integration host factor subunit alpha [Endozoicomonadaceae bacterium]
MTTHTKADITEHLHRKIGLNKKESKDFVQEFFDTISETLISGESVKLSGFGNFILHNKNARPGRNPKTGEEALITPRRIVTFRSGDKFKSKVSSSNLENS